MHIYNVYVSTNVCHSVLRSVRRQHLGVGFLLVLWNVAIWTQVKLRFAWQMFGLQSHLAEYKPNVNVYTVHFHLSKSTYKYHYTLQASTDAL